MGEEVAAGWASCGRPSECFRVEHVDAGNAVGADGRILGQLDRPRSVEMVDQLHERIGLRAARVNGSACDSALNVRKSLQSASHRHQHLTPTLRTPLLRLSFSCLFWILHHGGRWGSRIYWMKHVSVGGYLISMLALLVPLDFANDIVRSIWA